MNGQCPVLQETEPAEPGIFYSHGAMGQAAMPAWAFGSEKFSTILKDWYLFLRQKEC